MVIVSSVKNLPKSKKKSVGSSGAGVATGSSKKAGESKNAAVTIKNSKFSKPTPRPLVVATTSLVGVGRGKVKTTRNNTLPLPSPKAGLLSSNGPRIHAQRKFAQGANTAFSTSGLASVHSPAVTPTKDGNKFRKRVLTPISPPLKRPKTEDFLTFLCFRGTPALPPDLDFFQYAQPLQVEGIQVQNKKTKEVACVSTDTGTTTSIYTLQNVVSTKTSAAAVSNGNALVNVGSSKTGPASTSGSTTNRNGKHPVKPLTNSKRNSPAACGNSNKHGAGASTSTLEKSSVENSATNVSTVRKVIPNKKLVAGNVLTKKVAVTPAPQISPSASRINEQEAKFAMTALKLKYQEKRLANARPAKSLITMLTKKVKERSMVLTRSRAKTTVGPLKTSPLQRKRNQPIIRPPAKPAPRNVPSPDIILGVTHSPVKPVESSRRSSSSSSESDSEAESKKSSSSQSSSDSEEEAVPTTRSLRNGKELVTKMNNSSKTQKTSSSLSSSTGRKSSSPSRRMGTRASHRTTKSPLRELPMWNVNFKKKKILAKYKKNVAAKSKTNLKTATNVKNSLQNKTTTRSSLRKLSGFDKGRPSRKTKETAAIYLGLLNKGFSSDDDESNAESDGEERASSVGDTSASETNYLEKQYNASLKNTSSSKKNDGKSSKTSSRLRSHQKDSHHKSSSKEDHSKSSKLKHKEKSVSKKGSEKKEEKPMPRVLRSRSSGSVDSKSDFITAAERRRILMMTCGKNEAGAARKSAKIISRGKRGSTYSSSDDEGSTQSGSGSEEIEDEEEEKDEDEDQNSQSESEEVDIPEVPVTRRNSTASPMSIPSSRGSRAKVKRVAELISEFKRSDSKSSSSQRSSSSSPVGIRSKSESEDSKSLVSDRDKDDVKELIEQIDDDEEEDEDEMEVDTDDGEEDVEDADDEDEQEKVDQDVSIDADDEEKDDDDEGDDIEELKTTVDEEDDDDDVVASPAISVPLSTKDDELEDIDDDVIPSPAPSPVQQQNTSTTTDSSASEVESELEEDEDDEDTPEPVPKVDMACQVDMDLEEEEEEKRKQAERRAEEEKLKGEAAAVAAAKAKEATAAAKAKEAAAAVKAKEAADAARISRIHLPLSEQQKAELRQAQEEDDEIQEIGQVINNPTTINQNNRRRRASPSPPIIPEPPHIHRPPPPQQPQPQPEPVPLSIPFPMPPLSTRTSSLTYTSHHINLGGSSVPFVPFSSRPSTSDLFPPPPLHFGHTHLVNSVHLVGSSTTGHEVDFTGGLGNHLSALSIPVSVPPHPSFPNSLLPPPPICMGPGIGSATMTATSLQTHIRTVATNLDIPLVRPVVGSADTNISFGHLGIGHHPLGSVPLLGAPPTASLLSRPMGAWSQSSVLGAAAAAASAAEARNHYSAFRLPNLQPPVSSSAPTMMSSQDLIRPHVSTSLPVSIVHPRTMPHHHHHHQQHHQQQQQLHARPPQPPEHHHHHPHQHSSNSHSSQQRDVSHHQSSSSSASTYMQNYNPESIIRNLPNVSIVPKFDRSSAKTLLPSQQPSSCSSSSSSSKKQSSKKNEEPKKPGKKKSKPSTLPAPSSPLTVRKDSNPATYVSSKLKKKSDGNDTKEKSSSSHPPKNKDPPAPAPTQATNFDQLVTVKQERIDTSSTSHTTTGTHKACSSSKDSNKGKSSPGPALLRLDQIKQEIVPCSTSSSSRKSHSPSVGHRKTPDRPCSSGSANASEKLLPSAEENKKHGSKKTTSSSNSNTKKLLEAPTYHPTEQEFEDPLKYFDKIQPEAEKFGMARIVPPRSFRPECNVNDDMRFTAYNHYIHKMFKRWGPTVQETEAIKEHLKRTDMDVSSVPVIGGMEIDFSTLYQAVQSFGGLKEVIEQEKWAEVADRVHIPKGTHDRATKLDSVYVKYILPYDLLSEEERKNLRSQVQEKWIRRQQKLQERSGESSEDETSDEDSMDELDDCVIKGKGTPLSAYYRVARNTVGMIFPNGKEPPIQELEDEYWKIVREGKKHLCVYSGSIDCAGVGWGFPAPKASAKHPWNLKVLASNPGSVLRSMGPVMGATVPTLHVSMLFTSYCWYRDPHGLPWVEYLHSGASKIWYSVAAAHEQTLRKALMKLMPLQCKNKQLWLPSDSAMVPPELLLENGVPLVRAVQNPGEFLVVFPKSYTSAICGGYLVSESVCFAPPVWLRSCMELFKDIRDSKEPPVFPIEKLLLSIVRDNRVSTQVIKMAAPLAEKVILEELALRKKLISMGVSQGGKPNKNGSGKGVSKKKKSATEDEAEQCYFCNYILHMSLVRNERTDFVTCLHHAIQHLSRHKAQIKKCSLLCEDTQEELESLLQTAKRRANS